MCYYYYYYYAYFRAELSNDTYCVSKQTVTVGNRQRYDHFYRSVISCRHSRDAEIDWVTGMWSERRRKAARPEGRTHTNHAVGKQLRSYSSWVRTKRWAQVPSAMRRRICHAAAAAAAAWRLKHQRSRNRHSTSLTTVTTSMNPPNPYSLVHSLARLPSTPTPLLQRLLLQAKATLTVRHRVCGCVTASAVRSLAVNYRYSWLSLELIKDQLSLEQRGTLPACLQHLTGSALISTDSTRTALR